MRSMGSIGVMAAASMIATPAEPVIIVEDDDPRFVAAFAEIEKALGAEYANQARREIKLMLQHPAIERLTAEQIVEQIAGAVAEERKEKPKRPVRPVPFSENMTRQQKRQAERLAAKGRSF